MSDSNSSASGGIGLAGMVFIVFLILKLAEIGAVATWSWWWVTCPLWGPPVLLLSLVAVVFITALIVMGIAACFGKSINIQKKNFKFKIKRG